MKTSFEQLLQLDKVGDIEHEYTVHVFGKPVTLTLVFPGEQELQKYTNAATKGRVDKAVVDNRKLGNLLLGNHVKEFSEITREQLFEEGYSDLYDFIQSRFPIAAITEIIETLTGNPDLTGADEESTIEAMKKK